MKNLVYRIRSNDLYTSHLEYPLVSFKEEGENVFLLRIVPKFKETAEWAFDAGIFNATMEGKDFPCLGGNYMLLQDKYFVINKKYLQEERFFWLCGNIDCVCQKEHNGQLCIDLSVMGDSLKNLTYLFNNEHKAWNIQDEDIAYWDFDLNHERVLNQPLDVNLHGVTNDDMIRYADISPLNSQFFIETRKNFYMLDLVLINNEEKYKQWLKEKDIEETTYALKQYKECVDTLKSHLFTRTDDGNYLANWFWLSSAAEIIAEDDFVKITNKMMKKTITVKKDILKELLGSAQGVFAAQGFKKLN